MTGALWSSTSGSGSANHLAMELLTDETSLQNAADDFGHIVHQVPVAVLRPGSVDDIVAMVRNFQQSSEVVKAWGALEIRKLLDAFASDSSEFEPIRAA